MKKGRMCAASSSLNRSHHSILITPFPVPHFPTNTPPNRILYYADTLPKHTSLCFPPFSSFPPLLPPSHLPTYHNYLSNMSSPTTRKRVTGPARKSRLLRPTSPTACPSQATLDLQNEYDKARAVKEMARAKTLQTALVKSQKRDKDAKELTRKIYCLDLEYAASVSQRDLHRAWEVVETGDAMVVEACWRALGGDEKMFLVSYSKTYACCISDSIHTSLGVESCC